MDASLLMLWTAPTLRHESAIGGCVDTNRLRGAAHGEVRTIGLDIAKSVFQIHGVDAGGAVVIRSSAGKGRIRSRGSGSSRALCCGFEVFNWALWSSCNG